MSNALQNLMFKVSMLDHVSGTAGKIMTSMDSMTNKIQAGYQKIGVGMAGMVGSGYALNRMVGPAQEMASAIGEVRSLDVTDQALAKLTKTSLQFSMQYGSSATDFVRASYDIQSAIGGLNGDQLGKITKVSAVLAKGTKSDTGVITSYMGTMYSVFKDTANVMGKSKWAEQLAGQTAAAVKMFKTTGGGMASAFSVMGKEAQTSGVAMHEQIAVLGTLQASMSGSEAGTKYKAFLAGVGKAQDKLGLQFTDSAGKMLPVTQILQKIQGKFGDLNEIEKLDLRTAFGGKNALSFITSMYGDVNNLGKSIKVIGGINGMENAQKMALAITDPWDQAGQSVTAFNIVFGGKMLAVMKPVYNAITSISQKLIRWMEIFPNMTKWLGRAVVFIFGLTAAFGAFTVAMGLWTLVAAGAGIAWAFLSSPITLIVLGIGAMIGLIYYAITTFDQWSAVVLDFGQSLLETLGYFTLVDGVSAFFEFIANSFTNLKSWLLSFNLFDFMGDQINWIIDKLNYIPGIDISMNEAPKAPSVSEGAKPFQNVAAPPQGGVMKQMANMTNNSSSNKETQVVVNNYGNGLNGYTLADQLAMGGG